MLKTTTRNAAVTVVLTVVLAASALAQEPGQRPGAGQFNAFRERFKYTFQLMQMVRHIGEIDKDKKYTLKPDQAKRVLAVLKPLRSKPKLTQDQAKQALKGLKKVFTATQLNAMARIRPTFRPGGQQRRSGPPPGQAARAPQRRPDPNAMKDFNPFYVNPKAKAADQRSAQMAKRWNEFFAGLEKKAKSGKPVQDKRASGSRTTNQQPKKRQ